MQPMPFLWGVQYYRAPSQAPERWEEDLRNIKAMHCNTVKFWVQWRWSERREGEYYWDDLDRLMELAEKYRLKVILNLILDVMPVWVERDYPETLMTDRTGRPTPTQTFLARQLGGYPGPCYSSALMREKRERFSRAAMLHFKPCRALLAWDVWNEPENHSAQREADHIPELCYCPSCRSAFRLWLRKKYGSIERLNAVWGRCYNDFDEVEMPYDTGTLIDFVDWREFHLDKLTADAEWRLRLVREIDPERHPHLHTVPNTCWCFSSLTGVDDYALAERCEIFGASMMNDPQLCAQAISPARGKYFYNAEWHVNYGNITMHQRILGEERFLYELLPQIGWGVRGFLFWQYGAETIGRDAPAWGLVRPDGSPRPVTKHAERFIRAMEPELPLLLRCRSAAPRVMIYRSRRNDIFQFGCFGNLETFRRSLKQYADTLYRMNVPFGFTDRIDPSECALLILPQLYLLSHSEAEALDRFLQSGGVVFSESSLGGYDDDIGRHSEQTPGCGLAERWRIREEESTSSYHLPAEESADEVAGATGDLRKALEATGVQGGELFRLTGCDGTAGTGAIHFAELSGGETLAHFHGVACVVKQRVGSGTLFYAGTLLGYAAARENNELFHLLLQQACNAAGIPLPDSPIHTDLLHDEQGELRMLVAVNPGSDTATVSLPAGEWHELFDRSTTLEGATARLFIRKNLSQPEGVQES